jgi:UDP-glucose 4-epimerase
MKILVTGGLGTIGSCLSSRLYKLGYKVTIYDNHEIGKLSNLKFYLKEHEIKKIKIVKGDILNFKKLRSLIKNSDYIFNLAATLGTLKVVDFPTKMLNVNLIATHKIIDYCVKIKKPLIIFSTSMVYGKNPKTAVCEKDDLFVGGNTSVGLWWYAISKISEEAYANAVIKENPKAKILIIRPFNVIAPVQNPSVGFVFPRFFTNAMKNTPLLIYGNGNQRRTFTWVEDFVYCLLKLMNKNKFWRETINIGGTHSITIKNLAEAIKKKTKSKSSLKLIDPKKIYNNHFVEIQKRSPDVSKLKKFIGYVPNTSLNIMIDKFYFSYKKKYNLKIHK